MALSLQLKKDDPKTLILLWEGNLWKEVPKYLFINDLIKIPSELKWEEFLERFLLIEEKAARKLALFLLSKKSYLSSELEAKLLSKSFSPQATRSALDFCQEKGFLNDQQEISRLIAKEQRKGLGSKAIFFKLKQKKKIGDNLLRQGLDQTEVSEKEALEKWLLKNTRKIKRDDPLEMRKLMAKLIRRGFSAELVFQLLKDRP